MHLQACVVRHQIDDGTVILKMAASQEESAGYVLFKRKLEPTEEEIAQGHDALHLEINSPSQSTYGVIEEAKVIGEQLVLRLEGETAARLFRDAPNSSNAMDPMLEISIPGLSIMPENVTVPLQALLKETLLQIEESPAV